MFSDVRINVEFQLGTMDQYIIDDIVYLGEVVGAEIRIRALALSNFRKLVLTRFRVILMFKPCSGNDDVPVNLVVIGNSREGKTVVGEDPLLLWNHHFKEPKVLVELSYGTTIAKC